MDELFVNDPEPCETCKTGVQLFVGYDGVGRCRRCIRIYADERGWNHIVIPHIPKKRGRIVDKNQRIMKGFEPPPTPPL